MPAEFYCLTKESRDFVSVGCVQPTKLYLFGVMSDVIELITVSCSEKDDSANINVLPTRSLPRDDAEPEDILTFEELLTNPRPMAKLANGETKRFSFGDPEDGLVVIIRQAQPQNYLQN